MGGKCNKCLSTMSLEFDHIEPETCDFRISGNNLNKSWGCILEELKKCQLLCKKHHKEKTSKDRLAKHGTISRYFHRKLPCRCELCKEAASKARKTWPSRIKVVDGAK